MLNDSLLRALKSLASPSLLSEIMDYAVFPAGKLFRPKLVEALALDLNHKVEAHHLHLANALELHHAYTLVHDDLPAMDNDLVRRGKPATHAAFGEWKAILGGDALLIASFQELMKSNHSHCSSVLKFFCWATGAKGLIGGQWADLEAKGKISFSEILRIHELKTARLIQTATVGTYLLSSPKVDLKTFIAFFRLGREIGVSFQLLDDLNELTDKNVSVHEKEINPYLLAPQEALKELQNSYTRLKKIVEQRKLHHLEEMLNDYFKQNQNNLVTKFKNIELNMRDKLLLQDLHNWLTSFV